MNAINKFSPRILTYISLLLLFFIYIHSLIFVADVIIAVTIIIIIINIILKLCAIDGTKIQTL